MAWLRQILNDSLDMLLLDHKARDRVDARKFKAASRDVGFLKADCMKSIAVSRKPQNQETDA